MSVYDWLVAGLTLLLIIGYGIWKSRHNKGVEAFLLADRELPWYHVGLSVMATQASAITFLSAPGQGYSDGLRFVQFYFGLPLAMVVLCISFVPNFHRLNVYTAYEYLEQRFGLKTRLLTAFLFLLQRGLSTGITIYAPAIILSTILNIDITYTILVNGLLVITYTVYGGSKAVSHTHLLQMGIVFAGLFLAAGMVIWLLPEKVGLVDALHVAGKMEKLNAINLNWDWNDRYTIWSGLIGGFFLQLSYFGTDQSQVGRYLTGSSVNQSRWGLVMNGLIKIPMQFIILLIGVLVFTFYQFHPEPLYFNKFESQSLEQSRYKSEYRALSEEFDAVNRVKLQQVNRLVEALHQHDERGIAACKEDLRTSMQAQQNLKQKVQELVQRNNPRADRNDSNFIFLRFVTEKLPVGVIGLLIAIIFLAAMGSMASGLNSLASASVVDFYKRLIDPSATPHKELFWSRLLTLAWGLFCIVVALLAGRLGNLLEVVNILGSLFYGTILGIFVVAFYLKRIGGEAVFYAALIAEVFVVAAHLGDWAAFLWLNVIGCLLVVLFSIVLEKFLKKNH